MLTMTDRIMLRGRRAASALAPFLAIFLIVVNGKRW
jgi:hypothetical protein